jgi:transcription antitermination factor NusG
VQITKEQYVDVLETQYVISFIKQRQSLISIPEVEINLLKRIVGEIEDVTAGNIEMNIGDEVEIIGGNLTGVRGKLVEEGGKSRFVVQLASVGYQLSMIIDKSLLRLLKRTAAL